jgi:kynurenine formamidase
MTQEYRVYFTGSADLTVRVVADDPEEAIEQAYQDQPGDICAQCSGWRQKWSRDWPDEMEVYAVDDADGKQVVGPEKSALDILREENAKLRARLAENAERAAAAKGGQS